MDDWEQDRELVKKPNRMHSGHQCARKFAFSDASLLQRLNCIREWYILGVGNYLEKHPNFRGVHREVFYYNPSQP